MSSMRSLQVGVGMKQSHLTGTPSGYSALRGKGTGREPGHAGSCQVLSTTPGFQIVISPDANLVSLHFKDKEHLRGTRGPSQGQV